MRTRWIGASLGSLVVVAGMLVPSANAATATPPITPTPPSRAAATSQSHFLTGRRAGTPLSNAIRFLNASKSRYGLTPADISTARVTNKYTDSDTGTTHIYFQQMYRHIPVANSILSVNVARDGSIINVGNRFVRGIAIKAPPLQVTKTAGAAMGAAARALHLGSPGPLKQVAAAGGATRRSRLLAPAISTRPIDASLVWQPMKTGRVALAWNGQLVPRSGAHWWNVSVDAVTGSVAAVDDWVAHDVAGDGTYRAFAPPSQGPDPSNPVDSRTLFPSLADPTGSPYGWLDTNGVAGADSTVTFGNNADAGVDAVAPDGIDPGTEAPAASGLVFDSPWNPLLPVAQSTNAAVTNLFVWGNYVHDITSHYGFTEAAGNFQNLNYTGQGVGGDAVSMQDLDFSGTNNANFATPPDGTSGRMQMFRTTNGSSSTVTINSPVAIQGTINSLPSSNDAANVTIDNLPVVLVNDGNSITSDACESMPAGSLTGDIALVDRGTCQVPKRLRSGRVGGDPCQQRSVVNRPHEPYGCRGDSTPPGRHD